MNLDIHASYGGTLLVINMSQYDVRSMNICFTGQFEEIMFVIDLE